MVLGRVACGARHATEGSEYVYMRRHRPQTDSDPGPPKTSERERAEWPLVRWSMKSPPEHLV